MFFFKIKSDPKKFTPPVYAEDSKTVPVQILVETKKPNGEITIATLSITRYRPSIDIKNEYTASYVVSAYHVFFADFISFKFNPIFHQTPSGFYCPGRVNRKPLPNMPYAFSVINQLARTLVETRDLVGVINHVGVSIFLLIILFCYFAICYLKIFFKGRIRL